MYPAAATSLSASGCAGTREFEVDVDIGSSLGASPLGPRLGVLTGRVPFPLLFLGRVFGSC
jgi:hypothetical protein